MFKIDVFSTKVIVKFFKTEQELTKAVNSLYKRLKIKCSIDDNCEGIVIFDDNNTRNAYVFFVEKYISYRLIAHESYHLTNRILAFQNVNLTAFDDEQGAILIEYIVDKLIKYTQKKGYIIK